jgi:hypothetical protein
MNVKKIITLGLLYTTGIMGVDASSEIPVRLRSETFMHTADHEFNAHLSVSKANEDDIGKLQDAGVFNWSYDYFKVRVNTDQRAVKINYQHVIKHFCDYCNSHNGNFDAGTFPEQGEAISVARRASSSSQSGCCSKIREILMPSRTKPPTIAIDGAIFLITGDSITNNVPAGLEGFKFRYFLIHNANTGSVFVAQKKSLTRRVCGSFAVKAVAGGVAAVAGAVLLSRGFRPTKPEALDITDATGITDATKSTDLLMLTAGTRYSHPRSTPSAKPSSPLAIGSGADRTNPETTLAITQTRMPPLEAQQRPPTGSGTPAGTPIVKQAKEKSMPTWSQLGISTADEPAAPTAVLADEPAILIADKPTVPTADDPAIPTADEPAIPTADEPAILIADEPAIPTADEPAIPTADEPAIPTADEPAIPTAERLASEQPMELPHEWQALNKVCVMPKTPAEYEEFCKCAQESRLPAIREDDIAEAYGGRLFGAPKILRFHRWLRQNHERVLPGYTFFSKPTSIEVKGKVIYFRDGDLVRNDIWKEWQAKAKRTSK